jgi:hypothetical protein
MSSKLQILCTAVELSSKLPVKSVDSPSSISETPPTPLQSIQIAANYYKNSSSNFINALVTNTATTVSDPSSKSNAILSSSVTNTYDDENKQNLPPSQYHHRNCSIVSSPTMISDINAMNHCSCSDATRKLNNQNTTINNTTTSGNPSSKNRRRKGWTKRLWEERFEELKAYKDVHGTCSVPTMSQTNPSLGYWVHDQRKQYRLYKNGINTSSINQDRIQKLESIGFEWKKQSHTAATSWSQRYNQLIEYKSKYNHTNVPIRWKENRGLGQWVSTQRQEYLHYLMGKKSNMNTSRIERLESIGFVWQLRNGSKGRKK